MAAVILEPVAAQPPQPGYLAGVRDLATRHGAVLVFDEVITGFRYARGGAQEYFGVTPDLAAMGKGVANGQPLSIVCGKREFMAAFDEVFFSFTFGALPADEIRSLHELGMVVLGTATTVQEARTLEASGVDAVVAQGSEAGGHRGTFAAPAERALIGTLALVPQVVDAVKVPVVAAGGIMDGRGLVAAFALGAAAVQMGTAFLACVESGAHPLQKQAVLTRREDDATRLTRAFSGRLARGFGNRFMVDVERAGAILPYPHQAALTSDIRQAAARQGRAEFLPMLAGQGAPLAVARSAGDLVRDLVQQAERVAKALR